jgi:hypothetical protein
MQGQNESPAIVGVLYKKRGGFGKMMPNAWQYRLFMLSKCGVLTYYDPEVAADAEHLEGKERGRIDLLGTQYTVNHDVPEGAPTQVRRRSVSVSAVRQRSHPLLSSTDLSRPSAPYLVPPIPPIPCLSPLQYIITLTPTEGEKWRLCAESPEDHARWCAGVEKYRHQYVERKLFNRMSTMRLEGQSFDYSVEGGSRCSSPSRSPRPTSMGAPLPGTRSVSPPSPTHMPMKKGGKKRLKLSVGGDFVSQELVELCLVVFIVNVCVLGLISSRSSSISIDLSDVDVVPDFFYLTNLIYLVTLNVVVAHTLGLRAGRTAAAQGALAAIQVQLQEAQEALSVGEGERRVRSVSPPTNTSHTFHEEPMAHTLLHAHTHIHKHMSPVRESEREAEEVVGMVGKPTPGFSFRQVSTAPKLSPDHTWCQADHRQFNVRVGPDYNHYKKKAPSGPALYEAFAVDVFCTKLRADHAAQRFEMPPDLLAVDTGHPHIPPVFVVQIQIPSEPPNGFFTSSDDGPGWAIVMYYKITADTLAQLKDFSTASGAVKLFGEWCQRSTEDPAWRGRFKVRP